MRIINIITEKWTDADQQKIISFTVDEWKKKGSNLTIEQLQNWFQRLDLEFPPICIQAIKEQELLGWLLLVYHSDSETEINPWLLNGHPICKDGLSNATDISRVLIEKAIENISESNIARLELNFKNNLGYNIDPGNLYSQIGFKLVEQNCHMRYTLTNTITTDFSNNAFEIIPINQANFDELFQCFKITFRNAQDRWLNDKTDKELEDYLKEILIKSPFPLIKYASIAIKDDNKIIAFSIVRASHGQANGHLWIMGVLLEYRKQGLGSF
ncbi:MAG: GNAT family N-acetyltransferase, partial [Asgard group archaeon]|nr:GNAT family N-acetyltransferase [Asgard group archaeon]